MILKFIIKDFIYPQKDWPPYKAKETPSLLNPKSVSKTCPL